MLFLGHLKAVVISQEVAVEGIADTLDFIDRVTSIGNKVYIIISEKEQGKSFLSTESPLVTLPSLYLNNYFQADQKMGRTKDVKIFEYLRDSSKISAASTIPLVKTFENKLDIEGLAVLQDHKFVTKLVEKEVPISQLLKEKEIIDMNDTIQIEQDGSLERLSLARINLHATIKHDKTTPVHFTVKVHGKGKIIEVPRGNSSKSFIKQVEKQFNEELKKDIESTILKMQQVNVEPWLLGYSLWVEDKTYYSSLKWAESGFRNAVFDIEVDFKVDSTGQRGIFNKKIIESQ